MKMFEQQYDGESICDVPRDVHEAFSSTFNPVIRNIPVDEYGFQQGTFTITIQWSPE